MLGVTVLTVFTQIRLFARNILDVKSLSSRQRFYKRFLKRFRTCYTDLRKVSTYLTTHLTLRPWKRMRTSRPGLSRRHEPRFRPLQRASSTNRFMMMECEEYLPRSSAGRKIGFAEVEVEQ